MVETKTGGEEVSELDMIFALFVGACFVGMFLAIANAFDTKL